MLKIEDAVNGVLDALRDQGLKESSIQQISWSVYHPVINWHYEHGTEFCSDELLESLCERQRVRYECGEICRKFYRSFVTASYLFYTIRNGIPTKMSSDNVQRFVEKYGANARNQMSSIPHIHPHLFRHTRAMHLYMAGMPLEMVAQWLGHSQMETSLIYANATTEMKRAAIKKISTKENSVFGDNENFKYMDNGKIIKQLYGLE